MVVRAGREFSGSREAKMSVLLLTAVIYALLCSSVLGEASPTLQINILTDSPRLVVKLPDDNLLCVSFEGYEQFTYNLITSNYLVVNGFLNFSRFWSLDESSFKLKRGFNNIGFLIKAVDKRVRGGRRYFKHSIYEGKKKAILEGMGEMDLSEGTIVFSLKEGKSSIDSESSSQEEFKIVMDKPRCIIRAVSKDRHTFNLYIDDSFGLMGIDMHGLIGQFYHQLVRIDKKQQLLHLGHGRRVVPVKEDLVWDTVVDEPYGGQKCWYPDGESPLKGNLWDYIVEDLFSVHYKYSLFKS